MRGVWDANRLHQLLCNLVLNALTYGALDAPVRVVVAGMQSEVVIAVKNRGPMIERSTLHQIFDPLTRGPDNQDGPGPHGSRSWAVHLPGRSSLPTVAISARSPTKPKQCSPCVCREWAVGLWRLTHPL